MDTAVVVTEEFSKLKKSRDQLAHTLDGINYVLLEDVSPSEKVFRITTILEGLVRHLQGQLVTE